MRHIPIAEFKDRVSELVAAVEAGEEIVITRHGKPAARLIGVEEERRERRRRVVNEMLALGQEMRAKYGPIAMDDLIAWKNEGRP